MTPPDGTTPRQRVRLLSVQADSTPDSRCTVRVEIEWSGDKRLEGVESGNATHQRMLIAGSLATLDAIRTIAGEAVGLEFRGAKSVRGQAGERRYDLLGCCSAPVTRRWPAAEAYSRSWTRRTGF